MKVVYTYYSSDILENMLFATEEDALEFDRVLSDFVSDPVAINQFRKVMGHYASLGSIQRAIDLGEFHYGLIGTKIAAPLIKACENMVAGRNGLENDDVFREAMTFILSRVNSNEGNA